MPPRAAQRGSPGPLGLRSGGGWFSEATLIVVDFERGWEGSSELPPRSVGNGPAGPLGLRPGGFLFSGATAHSSFEWPIRPSERPAVLDIFPSERSPRHQCEELRMGRTGDGMAGGCGVVVGFTVSLDFKPDLQDFSKIPPRAVQRASPGPLGLRPGGFFFSGKVLWRNG